MYVYTQTQGSVSLWTPTLSLLYAQQPWSSIGEPTVKFYSVDGSINPKILIKNQAKQKESESNSWWFYLTMSKVWNLQPEPWTLGAGRATAKLATQPAAPLLRWMFKHPQNRMNFSSITSANNLAPVCWGDEQPGVWDLNGKRQGSMKWCFLKSVRGAHLARISGCQELHFATVRLNKCSLCLLWCLLRRQRAFCSVQF